ncbi:MAG: hypothetical protein ACHRHE_15255 [Tepidisphaerales bacterium]
MKSNKTMKTDLVLANINEAQRYLAKAQKAEDVQRVIALADAVRVYAKRIDASRETINSAAELRLRAERRRGDILETTPMAAG